MRTPNLDPLDRLFLARAGAVIESVEGQTVTLTLCVSTDALYKALAAVREHSQDLGGNAAESKTTHPQEESS